MRRITLLAMAIVASLQFFVCISTARAADAFDFKLNGDWYVDVTHVGKQQISVLGNNTENNTTIHMVFKVHVVKSDETGAELEHTIVAENDVVANGPQNLKDVFKGLRGQKFTVQLKPRNKDMEIIASPDLATAVFPNEIQNSTPAQKKMLHDMLTYILRVHIGEYYMPTPEMPVAEGGTWPHKQEMTLQSIAKIKSDREYKSGGAATADGKTADSVQWKGKLSASPVTDDSGALPFKVLEVGLVGEPVDTGTILWDRSTGRPAKVESKQEANMQMKYDINGTIVNATARTSDTFVLKAMEKFEHAE
jgi:hypothetical protein